MAKTDDVFDFGFSAVHETELPEIKHVDSKLQAMYTAIMPLLNNLKANPEKDYIKWPNRVEKIDEFILKLDKIMGK